MNKLFLVLIEGVLVSSAFILGKKKREDEFFKKVKYKNCF